MLPPFEVRTALPGRDFSDLPQKRIIKVLAFLEASTVSGAVKPVLEFARKAAPCEAGCEVSLSLALYARDGQENQLGDYLRESGLSVESIYEKHAFDLGVLLQLRKLSNRLHPDIIWTNNTKSHFLICLSGLHRSARWVAFHHGYTKEARRTAIYNQLDRISLLHANRVVTVCNAFAEELQHKGVPSDRIRILRNPVRESPPVPEETKSKIRAELGVENKSVLLSVGRLSFEKGHRDLLRAIGALRAERGEAFKSHLVIVGDGRERGTLQQLCSELALGDCVSFVGQQPDVAPYYSIADMCILPSHSEGSPNVMLEAAAAGVPIVATAVGGIPEVLSHEVNALLVPRQHIAELAMAIGRLQDDWLLRRQLVENGRKLLVQHSPTVYRRRLLGIFEEVIGETSAG
jgi:glycosyltransferase involved in cell wall biosynthesis